MVHHLSSLSPLQLKIITYSAHWKVQVLVSKLSLAAFILMLVMVFSEKWLVLSRIHFGQRWPVNVSNRIYTFAHFMSKGVLKICFKNCLNSENGKDGFKLWTWTNQPVFGVANITFSLALVLGFIFTIWLYLSCILGLQRWPFLGCVGTIMGFFEVVFIFSTLMSFPINLWMFELEKNLSIPIGWSYFIGWLVFILYVTCEILCYFMWNLILSPPGRTVPAGSVRSESQNKPSQKPLLRRKKPWLMNRRMMQ
ncbi:outer dense fiber protein 4 [Saccopteryx bilineata]|uniref:outer dense fiber protein 4 n=1 Tax=Saccopteryx bilineata TaxID=59482 RepID=UPI00338F507B